jgi:hypothetical protein
MQRFPLRLDAGISDFLSVMLRAHPDLFYQSFIEISPRLGQCQILGYDPNETTEGYRMNCRVRVAAKNPAFHLTPC